MKLRKSLVALTAMTATLVGAAAVSAPNASAANKKFSTLTQRTVQNAANYAAARNVHAAISVIDTQTGYMYTAGYSKSLFPSASVVKVYMATYLLRTGKMSGDNERHAWPMITQSSNSAFEYLLGKYFHGSATQLWHWIDSHYHFWRIGAPPTTSWCWGSTRITARGITRLYQKILKDPKVRPWLTNAMHHYRPVVDGFNQAFGIPSAAPHASIKQGWSNGCSPQWPYSTVLNSTGIVGNRYAVALLTESPRPMAWQRKVISHMARMLMPGGTVVMS